MDPDAAPGDCLKISLERDTALGLESTWVVKANGSSQRSVCDLL